MATKAIVSYDDTPNDHDALMFARVLADAGAELILAYVRHSTETEQAREQLEEHEAEALLERGARTLGDLAVERRVVVSASTAEGQSGSPRRRTPRSSCSAPITAPPAGHVAPQKSAIPCSRAARRPSRSRRPTTARPRLDLRPRGRAGRSGR